MRQKSENTSVSLRGILVRGILSVLLGVVLTIAGMSVNLLKNEGAETVVHAAAALSNPRIVSDSSMTAGQKVTWDCVWFGSYPQTEIVDNKETCGTYRKDWGKITDYVADTKLYSKLKSATGWDSQGDLTLDGKKYRRIRKSDATYSDSGSDGYYNWKDPDSYHYFRYDKIKWRVLQISEDQALLLADQALDDQQYNIIDIPVTWANSTIRSWLNGYDESMNCIRMGYTERNYIDSAFSSAEQDAIVLRGLDNKTTGSYSNNYGGDDTSDKVFLLAAYDLYNTNASASYGFYKEDSDREDEARGCKSSTYAKAMGTSSENSNDYSGNCSWWLRSPGYFDNYAASVYHDCFVYNYGCHANNYIFGVRPALYLNLSYSDQWAYAGTVCSDGTVKEDIGAATCTLNKENYLYTGSVVLPDITVTFAGKTLTPGTDYTISSKSKAAGKAVATITGKGDFTGTQSVTYRISPANLAGKKLGLSKTAYTYNAKVQKPTVKTVGGKALKAGTDYTIKYSNASSKATGTYTITVTGKGNYTGTSAKATYKINKAVNPLTVKSKTATVKFSAVKKKAQTLAVSKVLAVSRNQGKVTYVKAGGNAKITINKTTGKVTVKKGLKKGTYGVKTKVTAAGNANYKALTKTVTFKVKVS